MHIPKLSKSQTPPKFKSFKLNLPNMIPMMCDICLVRPSQRVSELYPFFGKFLMYPYFLIFCDKAGIMDIYTPHN